MEAYEAIFAAQMIPLRVVRADVDNRARTGNLRVRALSRSRGERWLARPADRPCCAELVARKSGIALSKMFDVQKWN